MADNRTRDDKGVPILPDRVVDKIRSGKQSSWALEEVMGEDAVEAVAAQNARAAEPIHAEDLTPMTAAEAARRTTFDGENLIKAPSTRRVLPAPFRRPVINLTLPWEPRRTWQDVPAREVSEGDIIPGIGQVASVGTEVVRETVAGVEGVPVEVVYVITGQGGVTAPYAGTTRLRVFRY